MNTQQHKYYQETVKDFDKDHCFWLDTDQLVYDKNSSQIRANGHVVDKFSDYAELFNQGVSFPPISVRQLPNGQWEVFEGLTRVGGATLAGKKILASDYMDRVEKFTPTQWEDWQAQANDHENSTPNTIKDIEVFIDKQCKNGSLSGKLGFKYDGNEEAFVEAAAKHYHHDIYRNSGKNRAFFRSKVKKALKGKVEGFYENYSKDQAFQFFATGTNFGGTGIGDISNNRVVYVYGAPNHASPAVIGHVASKLIENPNVKVSIVYYVKELVGKNDEKIFKERDAAIAWFDKVNAHYNWFDALYFLPQIKQGPNKENLYKLIQAR